ncbi:PRD domain-containing protein [Niallia sp. 03133]|uniref:PRD domain-containing protein n=1 Tax=Niallia sp. 03133 TaxID=3458060 RepID=UPI004043C310
MDKVQKVFVLKDETITKNYIRLIEEIPIQYIEITNYIISYASERLNGKLSDQIFVTLMDHISYALFRYNKNIIIQNRLVWEVKSFYPKEFSIGLDSVQLFLSMSKGACAFLISLRSKEADRIHAIKGQNSSIK